MARSIFKQILTLILTYFLIEGCAKISSPLGGPRDKEPPVIVKSTPENGARNFKGKRFAITFDEYVVLDKINEKFMISPPMVKKPKVSLKGKSLVVEYEDDLSDSTTYTFNFQDAIKDLNEGNEIDNYQFVFSTGPVIDSLSVTGNVYKAYDLNPPEETLILLYRKLEDSAVVKHIPGYISRADKKGYFRLDNLKTGTYRLYALKDADNSKNFNLPGEEFAFLDTSIVISPGKNYLPVVKDTVKVQNEKVNTTDTTVLKGEYRLILFLHEKKMHYLTSSARNTPYNLIYTLSLPPDTMGFDFSIPDTDAKSYLLERSKGNDTLRIWLSDSSLYSRQQINTLVRYPFTDTTGNIVKKEDTILMRFLMPRSTRGKTKPVPYSVKTSFSGSSLRPGQKIILTSLTPFRDPDTSLIRIYELTGTEKKAIPFRLNQDSTNSCKMTMDVMLVQGKNYLYVADSAAFGNVYGEQADSTGVKFSIRANDTFGKLTINIKNYQGDRIIQLLSSDEKVVREKQMDQDGKADFTFLDPGKYKIRVIYDLNIDGKWTTGDYEKGRQPEPVSFFPREIEVKANWEIDQDWDISDQNVKNIRITGKTSGTSSGTTPRTTPLR
ncbi:MAG: Ig-like domain-containing protein [Bacteroidales bacterium]|jgi:uncharacterized protein (DUF2141 family)|nr:Ig-like domain-containing protein [Bacteroidales bacterium]